MAKKEITTLNTLRVAVDVEARSFTVSVWRTHKMVKGERTLLPEKEQEMLDSETFYLADLPDEILAVLSLKGPAAILGQRTSTIKDDPLAKLVGMRSCWRDWEAGQYEKTRVAGPRLTPAIIEVLAEVTGSSIGSTQKQWNALSEATQKTLRTKYAEQVEALEAERASGEGPDLKGLAG